MEIADVLAVTFIVLGLVAVLTSFWLIFASLFPRFIRKSQCHCARPGKPFLVGLGVGFVPFFIGFLLYDRGDNTALNILGLLLAIPGVVAALAGSAVLATRIGNGMPSAIDRSEPWRRTLRGGIVLAIASVLPIVGWTLLSAVLVFGAGVAFLALRDFVRERDVETELDLEDSNSGSTSEIIHE